MRISAKPEAVFLHALASSARISRFRLLRLSLCSSILSGDSITLWAGLPLERIPNKA